MKSKTMQFRPAGFGHWLLAGAIPWRLIALGMVLLNGSPAGAEPLIFESAARQTSLLELYTSEGCSSCPPAEVWLSKLKDNPGLWREFVPVAFHVDYWNYLGWRDPWSQEEFSDRQREYAGVWGSANIYTPEFVLNGMEWQRPFWGNSVPKSRLENSGVLKVATADGRHWQASYSLPADSTSGLRVFQLHFALLVSDVSSDVKAGENAGRRLNHDFAVLNLKEQPLVSKTNQFMASFMIDQSLKPAGGRLALAAWITPNGKSEPVQAVGGWLPVQGN